MPDMSIVSRLGIVASAFTMYRVRNDKLPLTIRPAEIRDAIAMAPIRARNGRPSRAAFVAVEGKTIVGFVAARRTRRYGWRADVPRIREGLGRHLRDLQAFVTGLLFDETRITSAGKVWKSAEKQV